MANKKKIAVTSIWQKAIWTLAMVGVAVLIWFSIKTQMMRPLDKLKLDIVNIEGSRNLISQEIAHQQIENFLGAPVNEIAFQNINTRKLEDALRSDSRIDDAEVYIDGNHVLNVNITQREPILRVKAGQEDYYVDRKGQLIKTVKNTAVRVPIATGAISTYVSDWRSKKGHSLHDLVSLANELRKDDFLRALIEQIHIDKSGSITLIPKVGKQKLIMGTTEDLKEKLQNIKGAYKEVVRTKGFEKYDSLRFEIPNQLRAVTAHKLDMS